MMRSRSLNKNLSPTWVQLEYWRKVLRSLMERKYTDWIPTVRFHNCITLARWDGGQWDLRKRLKRQLTHADHAEDPIILGIVAHKAWIAQSWWASVYHRALLPQATMKVKCKLLRISARSTRLAGRSAGKLSISMVGRQRRQTPYPKLNWPK